MIKKFKVYFDGREQDKFETLFGAMVIKKRLTEQTELGLQASAFSSKEEETYDISGEYWLNDLGEENNTDDDASSALEVGTYHEHARNRLNSNIITIGHYGESKLKNNTLKW